MNRPEVMNAIDDDLPGALSAAVEEADADPDVHVMVLAGKGPAVCSGYDLAHYAEGKEALDVIERTGARLWEAELHRLRGNFLWRQGRVAPREVKEHLWRAITVRRGLGAKALELRGATSLARFMSETGETEEAMGNLKPVYDWFTEGFDTLDLKEAKTLLDELV